VVDGPLTEIVVLAIHSSEIIRRTCNKVLWLERGKLRMFGGVEEVLREYDQVVGFSTLQGPPN
jgi:ABC-type polysaccharide/polyol phosphate transport system ATPase subunit